MVVDLRWISSAVAAISFQFSKESKKESFKDPKSRDCIKRASKNPTKNPGKDPVKKSCHISELFNFRPSQKYLTNY